MREVDVDTHGLIPVRESPIYGDKMSKRLLDVDLGCAIIKKILRFSYFEMFCLYVFPGIPSEPHE